LGSLKILKIIAALAAINIALHLVFASLTEKGEIYPVSHRGAAALAPENTLAAVGAGVNSGARFIEIDVRLTSDGVPVLMHDASLERTTDGTGYVKERTWEYVKTLDAGSHFSPEFKGEPVPGLDEVLAYMKGARSTLVIEVKSPEDYPGIDDIILATLKKHGMEGRVVVVSFDAGWIEGFGKLAPEVSLGVLYVYPFAMPPPEEARYASVFWPAYALDPTLAWRLKRSGYEIWAWNVDNPWVAKFLVWKGVDGLVLDRPGMLRGEE